jgi:hypothetical protein
LDISSYFFSFDHQLLKELQPEEAIKLKEEQNPKVLPPS